MTHVTVVDARMGRGKSSAAINYMNKNKGAKRFLYITPILTEVNRVCECCDFDQPDDDHTTKTSQLRQLLHQGQNIAATHALFYLMTEDMLEVIREMKYTLIIDESMSSVRRVNVKEGDFDLITNVLTTEDDMGLLHWKKTGYTGAFYTYKEMADTLSLYRKGHTLLYIMSPAMLNAFDEVFMLTYMFDGQIDKGYFEHFGFPYDVVGVKHTLMGYDFSDAPDVPAPIDYSNLIHIVDKPKMNAIGDKKNDLSKAWFQRHGVKSDEIKALRRHLHNFFNNMSDGGADSRIWTTFKTCADKLIPPNGRYRSNYIALNARATNDFRHTTNVAYLANRFADPNMVNFFYDGNGPVINEKQYAVSELLQFVWRSAIRDGQPINLYLPSRRMRGLLNEWIETTKEGGTY